MHGSWHDRLDDGDHPVDAIVPTPVSGDNLPVHEDTASQPTHVPPVVLRPRAREERADDPLTDDLGVRPGQQGNVVRRGVPVPVVLVPRSGPAPAADGPHEDSDEGYTDELPADDDDLDGESLSEDDLATALAEDSSVAGDVASDVATIVLMYSDGLFGISCVNEVDVTGLCLAAVPTAPEAYGDLNGQYTWDVLRKALSDPVVDGVLWTPSAGTYRDVATSVRPALRGCQGHAIYGLPALSAQDKASLRSEDLHWHRTDEETTRLVKREKPWDILYQRLGDAD